ncbi:MAG TPA: UDP-glucose 4-epimerase GalE [Actinomycetospora sp.]|jgi:UDP-glucose 4-epimerase|uniref:UDP-glucose 4-epimerase GalE n=1 Tax=Actinomycetospora sp. TaxID=1872135 RepID=UPI002F421433
MHSRPTWLVVGGAGYIGSHVVRGLRAAGHAAVVLDDLSTGSRGRLPADVEFVHASLLDPRLDAVLSALADRRSIDGVVHLAAKKSVPESVAVPLYYYEQNVGGSVALLRAATAAGIGRVLYSSSAAVYGETSAEPVTEDDPTLPTSPYGETKLAGEWVVRRHAEATGLRWAALRYFNVAGSASERLADRGATNLVPLVMRAAEAGEPLSVFGDDWPTPDGTCLRDYVHVEDLADAHVAAAEALLDHARPSPGVLNVGRNEPTSVLDVIAAAERVLDAPVPYRIAPRRRGDPACVVADASRIAKVLDWRASRDVLDMLRR